MNFNFHVKKSPRPAPRPVPGSVPNVDPQFLYNLRRQKSTPPVNLVKRLIHREIFFVNPNVSPFIAIRKFHQNLLPNFSVENVEKPTCFLRKFTYDGRYLMAFSHDQTSVEFYEYQGPAAAGHLMMHVNSLEQDCLKPSHRDYLAIRKLIFRAFFKLRHSVMVTSNGEQLNRDCSLFSEDHRFAIVVSAAYINEDAAIYYNQNQNNESLPVATRTMLEDYTIHIVDIERGVVTSRKTFKTDKIYLAYNQGIYLYKNILAVLSIQHQTIYIFNINREGVFDGGRKIGRFCFENDENLVEAAYRLPMPGGRSNSGRAVSRAYSVHPSRETPYNALKHRLLVALYRYAEIKSRQLGNSLPRKQFFRNFSTLAGLRISKMQLLDEDHLLIKYEQETDKASAAELLRRTWNTFVVYNYKTATIVNLYPQFSEELFYIYENLSDYFRFPPYYICSVSNNVYARQIHQQLIRTCTEAKGGSYQDAVKMLLTILPLNAQAYTPR